MNVVVPCLFSGAFLTGEQGEARAHWPSGPRRRGSAQAWIVVCVLVLFPILESNSTSKRRLPTQPQYSSRKNHPSLSDVRWVSPDRRGTGQLAWGGFPAIAREYQN